MPILKIAGYGASAALASPKSIGSTQAAMAPAVNAGNANVHYVDCAVGFHIGPAGACILGSDNDKLVASVSRRCRRPAACGRRAQR